MREQLPLADAHLLVDEDLDDVAGDHWADVDQVRIQKGIVRQRVREAIEQPGCADCCHGQEDAAQRQHADEATARTWLGRSVGTHDFVSSTGKQSRSAILSHSVLHQFALPWSPDQEVADVRERCPAHTPAGPG